MRWPWQRDDDDDLIKDLASRLGESPASVTRRRLASARGPVDAVVALRDALALRHSEAGQPEAETTDPWRVLQWPEVRSGAWDGETGRLSVTMLDGSTQRLQLSEPGRLPGVFHERVQSTILVEERIPVPGGEVLVSGRRQPAGADTTTGERPVVWHAVAIGRADLTEPGVSRLVIAATERLRADYEL
ncbi:MAG: hypothetical protein M0Z51_01160 [Propionibacterium sp.]|nr:hypothetical protein [Propionibacterium sp.]